MASSVHHCLCPCHVQLPFQTFLLIVADVSHGGCAVPLPTYPRPLLVRGPSPSGFGSRLEKHNGQDAVPGCLPDPQPLPSLADPFPQPVLSLVVVISPPVLYQAGPCGQLVHV